MSSPAQNRAGNIAVTSRSHFSLLHLDVRHATQKTRMLELAAMNWSSLSLKSMSDLHAQNRTLQLLRMVDRPIQESLAQERQEDVLHIVASLRLSCAAPKETDSAFQQAI